MSMQETINKHQSRDKATVKSLAAIVEHFTLDNTSAPEGLTLAQATDLLAQVEAVRVKVASPIDEK